MIRLIAVLCVLWQVDMSYAVNLSVPLACKYGENCYIARYFDHETEEPGKAADYTCGALSEDGYKATDIVLEDFTLMDRGVPVLAGEAGVVEFVRDGMQDMAVHQVGEEAIRGRECGNGVILRHGRGYTTQYCHLKENSVTVKRGERVEQGQTIGQVGVSGNVDYPRLTFYVLRNGQAIDPFTGEDPVTDSPDVPCGAADTYPLWNRKTERRLSYVTSAQLYAGFSTAAPHPEGARRGKFRAKTAGKHEPFLVYWADIFGVMPGDTLELSIRDPKNNVVTTNTRKIMVAGSRYFQRIVARRPTALKRWNTGEYKGTLRVTRNIGDYADVMITAETPLQVR